MTQFEEDFQDWEKKPGGEGDQAFHRSVSEFFEQAKKLRQIPVLNAQARAEYRKALDDFDSRFTGFGAP